jgi:hypothetical protein
LGVARYFRDLHLDALETRTTQNTSDHEANYQTTNQSGKAAEDDDRLLLARHNGCSFQRNRAAGRKPKALADARKKSRRRDALAGRGERLATSRNRRPNV